MKFPQQNSGPDFTYASEFWVFRDRQGAQLLGRAGLTLCSEDSDPAAAVNFFSVPVFMGLQKVY